MHFFDKPYNKQEFQKFLERDFLPEDFSIEKEKITLPPGANRITEIEKIGRVPSLDNLVVYEIHHQSENDPRVSLTRESFSLLKHYGVKNALAVFVSENSDNYRFSLITSGFKINEKGHAKRKFSNPRRYSFYLGPDAKVKTPTLYLKEKGRVADFDDLQSRFDIQVLTKEFYKELSNWYFWALRNVKFPKDAQRQNGGKNIAVIRLITRLVFIWFMKKKGLVPNHLFDPESINKILADLGDEKSTYYKAILQNLFFATLNTPPEKRRCRSQVIGYKSHNPDFERRNVYHYEDYFQEPGKILENFKGIPFLNGGLFECLDKKRQESPIYIDGFSQTKKNQPEVPNFLFFSSEQEIDLNQEYGTKNKRYKVKGLVNILNDYNFTIDENTPIDQEVSLDPELLGRIFENLLASYNPETATTARKATGSYYTPRPIVEYMVDESLKQYFLEKLAATREDEEALQGKIDGLLSYYQEEHELDKEQVDILIKAIEELKIIDPAVGSGAFPMGILQKLVLVLNKLDPHNEKWKERQIKAVNRNVTDVTLRVKLREEIEESFENSELDYGRKLYLIQKCIYGVDIQPIAIQIAKLRFFISLLVDENIEKGKENKGIEPLPNLETKFVAANSLVKLEKPSLKSSKISGLETGLKKTREEHFSASLPQDKEKVRKKDQRLRRELLEEYHSFGLPNKLIEQIAGWDPYNTNTAADFFDPEWMFGVKAFDIVIANPPYIQLQKDHGKLGNLYHDKGFQTFARTGDIYCLFYERGLEISKDSTGILCYISSNKWMRAKYGKKLRKFLASKNPLKLINFGGYKVFKEQTVDTNILIVQNSKNGNNLKAVKIGTDFTEEANLSDYFEENKVSLKNLSEDTWFIGTKAEMKLKEKIEKIGTPLRDWDINIYRGVLTGYNNAFIIDEAKRAELIEKDPKSEEIIKPILRGRDIKRYGYDSAGRYLINTHNGYITSDGKKIPRVDIDQYPAIKDHLNNYWSNIKDRYDQGDTPYNLRNCAYLEEFEKEKIAWQEISEGPSFTRLDKDFFVPNTAYILTDYSSYLLGFLNSQLTNWYFRRISQTLGRKGLRFLNQYMLKIPVPQINNQNKDLVQKIENLVDKILQKKKQNPDADISDLETQIDQLVYKLYNLTPEEIKIVENSQS